jgi:hypothetical protein
MSICALPADPFVVTTIYTPIFRAFNDDVGVVNMIDYHLSHLQSRPRPVLSSHPQPPAQLQHGESINIMLHIITHGRWKKRHLWKVS